MQLGPSWPTSTIVAIIGTSCSSAGVSGSAIASEAGVLMVSPSNTAPSLTAEETHEPFYARTAHNDTVQGAAMAQFICDELPDITTAATLHDASPYAEQLQQVFADQFVEQCGGEIVYQGQVSPTESNFTDRARRHRGCRRPDGVLPDLHRGWCGDDPAGPRASGV